MITFNGKTYKFDQTITFADDFTAWYDSDTDEMVIESNGKVYRAKPTKKN